MSRSNCALLATVAFVAPLLARLRREQRLAKLKTFSSARKRGEAGSHKPVTLGGEGWAKRAVSTFEMYTVGGWNGKEYQETTRARINSRYCGYESNRVFSTCLYIIAKPFHRNESPNFPLLRLSSLVNRRSVSRFDSNRIEAGSGDDG